MNKSIVLGILFSFLLVGCGSGAGGSTTTTTTTTTTPTTLIGLSLLAGNIGGSGNLDGTGSAAHFNTPGYSVFDAGGNLYVTDALNHTIRKITPAGLVSTVAGTSGVTGSTDGAGAVALFNTPIGITIDTVGNLYVADASNRTIRKITPAGVVSTFAGTAGVAGSVDGIGTAASFTGPGGIAIDQAGNLYVTENAMHTIRKITPAAVVSTFAGTAGAAGSADGIGTAASFNNPSGITIDVAGTLFVTEYWGNTIRKITTAGVVSTFAGTAGVVGSADGIGAAASFNFPGGLAIDAASNLYVADLQNHTIRKVSPAGVVSTFVGTAGVIGSTDGNGTSASFNRPGAITLDTANNLYIADRGNFTIRKITSAGVVSTFSGLAAVTGNTDGPGTTAKFNSPIGMTYDASGNLYVTDSKNNTIRKITSSGVVSTIAGTAGVAGSTDGTGLAAKFNLPANLVMDVGGNLYVTDVWNHAIRKITPAGVVSTFAGTAGVPGSADGVGIAASFNYPVGITIDLSGNLYVSDAGNYTIRKITSAGAVSTFTGTAGVTGSSDGTGAAASFASISGLTIDVTGNLYVSDYGNNTIRKISPSAAVSTFAGTTGVTGSADGTGTSAQFYNPSGLTIDAASNLFVADSNNHTIRQISPSGVVVTVAGVATKKGIVLGALPGYLNNPKGIVFTGGKTFAITSSNSILTLVLP